MKKLILLIIAIVAAVILMTAVILVANVQAQCEGGPKPSGPTPWPAGGSEKADGSPAMCQVANIAVDSGQG